jgi:hypothetical protein
MGGFFSGGERGPGPGLIPAFLSIDVEPDGFQLSRANPPAWGGYDAAFELAGQLRARLAERTGATPAFGWYFRTDEQIAEIYGRADHVMVAYPERTRQLAAHGDYFGIHPHPLRWCATRRLWVHEFGDAAWLTRFVESSLEAYAGWAGAPAARYRAGAGFLTNEMVETAERCGVQVDLSLEPVAGWGLRASVVPTSIDESPIVGPYPDCRHAPRRPFRPAYHDFRVSGGRRGRRLVMVPLATAEPAPSRSRRHRLARWLRGAPPPDAEMLYASVPWPSPRHFWDLAARYLTSTRSPCLSLAIRTDVAELREAEQVRRIFEALPDHPLAQRLRFVDPLPIASRLV